MAAGSEIDIPSLPVGDAANALLHADPILGAVVIFETAAICFLVWWIRGVYREHEEAQAAKDKELADAKDSHIADLKLNIPAMSELRETILRVLPQGRRS